MASGTIKNSGVKSYTTSWLHPIFNNVVQVALGSLSELTNGIITDVSQLKGAPIVTNGFIQMYINGTSGNPNVYVYSVTCQPITTSGYYMKISFLY